MKRGINELAKEVFENAKSKGFHEGEKNIGEMLCLIHSEVSEALEADRKGRWCSFSIDRVLDIVDDKLFLGMFRQEVKDTFEDEIADTMIRCLDLAGRFGIDIESHIKAKMRYNESREPMHGKKY